jgi:PAS domain S-box-containing protein
VVFGVTFRAQPLLLFIAFQEPAVWGEYNWRIIAVISICILQTLLILLLLATRWKHRNAEKEKGALAAIVQSSDEMMADTAPIMIWVAGPNAFCTFLNRRWLEFTGRTMEQETGSGWSANIHPDDYPYFLDIYVIAYRARRSYVIEYRLKRADEKYRWVEVTGVPRLMPNGELTGYIGTCLDITERKLDEDVRQKLTVRLLEMHDEERKRVAAELHDGLGQSLAIIKNRAMIGLKEKTSHENILEQLREISSTATAAILEVREIAHNLRPYELDRLGLVAAIESMVQRVSESTSISLSTHLEQIEGMLSAEAETSIYRIVQEGINNVIKHSNATSARIEIRKNGTQLAISVQDNGIGIPKQPPEILGAKTNGLGLVGIAERVRGVGGSFEIDSEPERGTTLMIRLESESVATK